MSKHMAKASALFEEDGLEDGELKVNPEFAKKFEHNKRRELLEKGKEVYGEKALLGSDASSKSSSEDEDDEGHLINAKLEKKFLETIAMIRSNDPKLKTE